MRPTSTNRRTSQFALWGVVITLLIALPSLATALPPAPLEVLWLPTARISNANDPPIMSHQFCDLFDGPPCGSADSDFGTAVALEDDVALVGHPDAQEIHLYEKTAVGWSILQTFQGPAGFGKSVATDAGLAAATAPDASELHVFHHDGKAWHHNATLALSGSPCLVAAVDVLANRIAIGSSCSSTVTVHEWTGTHWEATTVTPPADVARFGRFVAWAENNLIVAAQSAVFAVPTDAGWLPEMIAPFGSAAVAADGDFVALATSNELHVLERQAGTWTETARLTPQDASPFDGYDEFGRAIALRGNTVVVGAPDDDVSPGMPNLEPLADQPCTAVMSASICVPPKGGGVYVFEMTDGQWQQTAKLLGDPGTEDRFGSAVALGTDGKTLLVGAPRTLTRAADVNVDHEDAVHVFTKGGI